MSKRIYSDRPSLEQLIRSWLAGHRGAPPVGDSITLPYRDEEDQVYSVTKVNWYKKEGIPKKLWYLTLEATCVLCSSRFEVTVRPGCKGFTRTCQEHRGRARKTPRSSPSRVGVHVAWDYGAAEEGGWRYVEQAESDTRSSETGSYSSVSAAQPKAAQAVKDALETYALVGGEMPFRQLARAITARSGIDAREIGIALHRAKDAGELQMKDGLVSFD